MSEQGSPGFHISDFPVAAYDSIVDAYDLLILKEVGDWSIDDGGGLVMTEDGSPQQRDIAHNGLFRLVQMWRYSEPHLRFLFAALKETLAQRVASDDALNAVGEKAHAEVMRGHRMPSHEFGEALHDVLDRQAGATLGQVSTQVH